MIVAATDRAITVKAAITREDVAATRAITVLWIVAPLTTAITVAPIPVKTTEEIKATITVLRATAIVIIRAAATNTVIWTDNNSWI